MCCTAPLMPNARYSSGLDDDAGRADLALVADPTAVGDHAGGAHAAAERGSDAASCSNRSAESRPAPPATMRSASARSIVVTSGGWTATTVGSGSFASVERDGPTASRRPTLARLDAADARLERRHDRRYDGEDVELQPTSARHRDPVGRDRHRAGDERPVEHVGDAGREVATVGRRRQHDDRLVGEELHRVTLPTTRARTVAELDRAHIGGADQIRRDRADRRRGPPARRTRRSSRALPPGARRRVRGSRPTWFEQRYGTPRATISARAMADAALGVAFDARLARRWRTTSIITVSENAAANASRKALV